MTCDDLKRVANEILYQVSTNEMYSEVVEDMLKEIKESILEIPNNEETILENATEHINSTSHVEEIDNVSNEKQSGQK